MSRSGHTSTQATSLFRWHLGEVRCKWLLTMECSDVSITAVVWLCAVCGHVYVCVCACVLTAWCASVLRVFGLNVIMPVASSFAADGGGVVRLCLLTMWQRALWRIASVESQRCSLVQIALTWTCVVISVYHTVRIALCSSSCKIQYRRYNCSVSARKCAAFDSCHTTITSGIIGELKHIYCEKLGMADQLHALRRY